MPKVSKQMTEARTILVVDDDPALREGLEAVLQKRGFRTLGAEDGLVAGELIRAHRPDLVVLDMMMPRCGGFLVLENFRRQPEAPPFIMITANEEERLKAHAENAGVVDYIRKPFSIDRLLAGIHKGLRESAPRSNSAVSAEASERPASRAGRIQCRCAACGAGIKAAARLLGQRRACPRCGHSVLVQPIPPEDEGPKLVLEASA